ncbi:hypothetical protein ACQWB4_23005, partial [Salmonella enterica subsp. enterica serovar Infantis]
VGFAGVADGVFLGVFFFFPLGFAARVFNALFWCLFVRLGFFYIFLLVVCYFFCVSPPNK